MTITTATRLASDTDPAASIGRITASLAPSSWNERDRTVDVVWTTGATVRLLDPFSGDQVDETLRIGAGNVRLGRLNAGAPVLDHHNSFSLGGQIGVVVPGSARMIASGGVAKLRLSDRPDLAPIVADIASGIIRNVSVGYCRHAKTVVERPNASTLWDVTDWEPTEISFVTVPADAGASVRSHPSSTARRHPLENNMPDDIDENVLDASAPERGSRSHAANRALLPASVRELRSCAQMMNDNLPAAEVTDFVLDVAERALPIEEVRREANALMASRQRQLIGGISNFRHGAPAGERTFDNPEFLGSTIGDALYARLSGSAPSDAAREMMGLSMVQMAGRMLERNGVRNVGGMSANEVLEAAAWNRVGARAGFMNDTVRAYHTTSDFPDLLIGAGDRFLRETFQAAASPLKTIGRKRSASDFRPIFGLQLSNFGTLHEVPENGEIKQGTFHTRKDTFALKTFAKTFNLSRQAIINDDLGAFGEPVRIMGRAAAETEAQVLVDLIRRNPSMSDGRPLFHAAHGNLAAEGSAPSLAAFSAGRKAMRAQKDADGVTPLATAPLYILSGPELETDIEQLVATTTSPALSDQVNPFAGKLRQLVEPRLEGFGWDLFADPQQTPVLEYGYLNNNEEPKIETKDGWQTLGQSFRIYMDFGAGLVDHRGAYRNTGKPA